MGIDTEAIDDILLHCLTSMKRTEIASFRIELIGTDRKRARRYLDEKFYLFIEVFDWETIIDMNGDLHCMKHVLRKGTGIERLKRSDEANASLILKLRDSEKVLLTHNFKEGQVLSEILPTSIFQLLLYSKEGEESKIDVKMEYFEMNENDLSFLEMLKSQHLAVVRDVGGEFVGASNPRSNEYPFTLHVSLQQLFQNEDLFGDGSVLKKRLKSSYSAAKPDPHCRVYFDYRIRSLNAAFDQPTIHDGLAKQL